MFTFSFHSPMLFSFRGRIAERVLCCATVWNFMGLLFVARGARGGRHQGTLTGEKYFRGNAHFGVSHRWWQREYSQGESAPLRCHSACGLTTLGTRDAPRICYHHGRVNMQTFPATHRLTDVSSSNTGPLARLETKQIWSSPSLVTSATLQSSKPCTLDVTPTSSWTSWCSVRRWGRPHLHHHHHLHHHSHPHPHPHPHQAHHLHHAREFALSCFLAYASALRLLKVGSCPLTRRLHASALSNSFPGVCAASVCRRVALLGPGFARVAPMGTYRGGFAGATASDAPAWMRELTFDVQEAALEGTFHHLPPPKIGTGNGRNCSRDAPNANTNKNDMQELPRRLAARLATAPVAETGDAEPPNSTEENGVGSTKKIRVFLPNAMLKDMRAGATSYNGPRPTPQPPMAALKEIHFNVVDSSHMWAVREAATLAGDVSYTPQQNRQLDTPAPQEQPYALGRCPHPDKGSSCTEAATAPANAATSVDVGAATAAVNVEGLPTTTAPATTSTCAISAPAALGRLSIPSVSPHLAFAVTAGFQPKAVGSYDSKAMKSRKWVIPPKPQVAVTFTLAWPKGLRSSVVQVPQAVTLAVMRTLDRLGVSASKMKWINDVYVRGKKMAGVLCALPQASLKNHPGISSLHAEFNLARHTSTPTTNATS
eukprot:GHVT01026216.1.p1 GENE.GHVT01026216.1~~GHVT01026216.1.p1  ORF type:complete len:655 (+),score=64.51 GHVT01026216.1:62-2026(+)